MTPQRAIFLLLSLLLTACIGRRTVVPLPTPPPATIPTTAEVAAEADFQVVLASSQLVLGPNRFAVALLRPNGTVIHEAAVRFTYFDLSNSAAPVVEQAADASRIQSSDGQTTLFVQERDFNRAGDWGVQVDARFPDGTTALQRISFAVAADSPAIVPGDEAPAVDTPTSADHTLAELTSATHPNPAFYRQSLAQALQSGKPTLLYLATPAYCASRLCGPGYETFDALHQQWGDRFNFVNVEVYTGLPEPAASGWQLAPVMGEFGLTSEPWLYLIDSQGVVSYRVEGLFTAEEVSRHLQTLQ